jgi:hypothetical protein
LQFEAMTLPGQGETEDGPSPALAKGKLQEHSQDKNKEKNREKRPVGRASVPATRPASPPAEAAQPGETPSPSDDKPGAEVVRLDRFRKK